MDESLSGFADMGDRGPKSKEGGEVGDVLSGFDDIGDNGKETLGNDQEKSSWWGLDVFLRLDSSYNYAHDTPGPGQPDYYGLSKLCGQRFTSKCLSP